MQMFYRSYQNVVNFKGSLLKNKSLFRGTKNEAHVFF